MDALVSFRDLTRRFRQGGLGRRRLFTAVDSVSLDFAPGKTLGVVGESGSGKSTLGRMAVGLLEPTGGEVYFRGTALYKTAPHKDYKAFRKGLAGRVQMIFQDPYSSLNPRMSVGECVGEPLACTRPDLSREKRRAMAEAMLEQVGLGSDWASRWPHEFSGGQRQRIAIARALITQPDFVVCDEPTSSLDASVQAQVLNLLAQMQEKLSLTCMFISHDLGVVRHMADRVAVMYRGLVVEEGDAEALFARPCHPYTRLLLASVTDPFAPGGQEYFERANREPTPLPSVSAGGAEAPGCPFASRCPERMGTCLERVPDLLPVQESGSTGGMRLVRCFLA